MLFPVNTISASGPGDWRIGFGGPGDRISRHGIFEGAIRHPTPAGDPFRDVRLTTCFESPSGRIRYFRGFYDGDDCWRFRYRPDELGGWRYSAWFSGGGTRCSGTFEVVEGDIPAPISVFRPNPIWFGQGGEHPFYPRGLHIGDRFFAANWPHEKRAAFLDYVQRQGYNLLSVASHFLNRTSEGRGLGWETPDLWPLNPSEYTRMESILADLAARRIVVFPFGGFFGRDSNYPREPADQELYLSYTLARIGPYWNILFNVAGPEPNLVPWMEAEEVERLARLIRRLDGFNHPISVHNKTGDDEYKHADWTDFSTLQGPKTVDRKQLWRGLRQNRNSAKPLLAQETLWTGNMYHLREPWQPRNDYTEEDVVRNGWVLALAGTALCYGDNNGNSSSGFSGTLELSERNQRFHDILKRIWDFMEQVPYYRMRPIHDAASDAYVLGEPGVEYLVFFESAEETTLALADSTHYRGRWHRAECPGVPEYAVVLDHYRAGEPLHPPEAGRDWLLHLNRHPKVEIK